MRIVDLDNWPRRQQYNFLKDFSYPHFSLCANMDISAFYPKAKLSGSTFTIAFVYALSRAANEITEFRYRMRGDEVVEHDSVHPSVTVLTEGDLFSFCELEYSDDFFIFAAHAAERYASVKENPAVENVPGRDDYLYMTSLPWVSFTSMIHPLDLKNIDSIPRFAWGKFFQEGDRLKIPLSVQAHHALMDGIHMGRYFQIVQDYFDNPDLFLKMG
jgi:chloramphenicol O-acetyltransferase type A